MRNVIYAINTTLDGCCDHTKFSPNEETFEYMCSPTVHQVRGWKCRLSCGLCEKQAIFGHYKIVI